MRMTDELWTQIRYFKPTERGLASKDNPDSYNMLQVRPMFALDALRGILGHSIGINSGYRTPAHNKAVGGAPRSQHLDGNAFDVNTSGWTKEQRRNLIISARKLGFTGIGIAQTFLHVDMAPRTAAWIYVDGGQKAISLTDELNYA